jgi:RNA polymerase sigma-70 factor (ECF subfamily)
MSTWLGRIVINSALTRRRAMRRRPEESLDTLLERPEPRSYRHTPFAVDGPGPEGTLLRSEIGSLLRSAVDELPDDYRTVVILRHFEDVPNAEIASRLRITPNAAKLRLLRAHRALRRLLAQRGYDQPIGGLK